MPRPAAASSQSAWSQQSSPLPAMLCCLPELDAEPMDATECGPAIGPLKLVARYCARAVQEGWEDDWDPGQTTAVSESRDVDAESPSRWLRSQFGKLLDDALTSREPATAWEAAQRTDALAPPPAYYEVEARQFIEKHALAGAVSVAVDVLRQCFRELCSLRITLDADPEIPDYERVCLSPRVRGTVEDVLRSEDAFDEAICERLSADERRLIVLTVIMAD